MKVSMLLAVLLPGLVLANFPDDQGINDGKFFPHYGSLPPITEPHKPNQAAGITTDQERIDRLNNSQINQLGQVCRSLTVAECIKQKPDAVKSILQH